jgi:transposase
VIDVETVARIRHLFYAEHWRVGTIASELGLHHATVQRALSDGPRAPAPVRPSLFDPYVGLVRETLEKHPRLTATRVWQMLVERGCTLSPRQVRDKLRTLRPSRREAFLRRRVFPGEEGQVDWASFGHVMVGAARRALSAFVLTLTHSRWFFLRFFLDQSMESFLRGHVYAFEDLRGVPRYCLYDNLRSAVLDRLGQAVRFNPRLLELASHYHFAPKACRPARGNEKGAVERTIRYVRDSFFAARSFTSVDELNRQALVWRDEVAGARRWPGDDRRTVAEAYEDERRQLLCLPTHPFETDSIVPVRSGKSIYVRFDLNDYSIPPAAVGRTLTLSVSETTLRVLDAGDEIARHRRSYDRHRRIEDARHIEQLLEHKRRALGSTPRTRLTAVVPSAEAFLEACFERGESVAATTEKLLLLLDDYGAAELSAVVDEALERQTPRLSSVAYVLARRHRAARHRAAVPVDLSRRPDLRDLYVTPHPARTYDDLANLDKENDDDERHD